MKNPCSHDLTAIWKEAQTRLIIVVEQLTEEDLPKTLGKSPNSIGFLLRHIADVELLFAKNVFGLPDVRVTAKTVIAGKDTGEWRNLPELLNYLNQAQELLNKAIENQEEAQWKDTITTKEFGTKTKFEAFGRIVSHTAYHAGQLALIYKYGNI